MSKFSSAYNQKFTFVTVSGMSIVNYPKYTVIEQKKRKSTS